MGEKSSSGPPRPTDAELAIIRVLWRLGNATVREVMEALNANRTEALAYTTVLKFLQIMTEKGLVIRDGRERTHVYCPAQAEGKTKTQMVRDLADRVFEGSARALVVQALGSGRISARELTEIKSFIDQLGNKS